MNDKYIKKIVKKRYQDVAESSHRCGCHNTNDADIARVIGYSKEDIEKFSDANMGLGCGNPTALGAIEQGDVVLDLGSGPGLDCFLASKKVGETGQVIGVDMTEAMIHKAEENARKYGITNVEFRFGEIDNLPVETGSIDVILSNCVINLAPDKKKVFSEAYRVLKPTGRMYVSDIVLLEELTAKQRQDEELIAGCVGGAVLKGEYLKIIMDAGFKIDILTENKGISKEQYQGFPLESLSIVATKKS